jgi:hypothetical protein
MTGSPTAKKPSVSQLPEEFHAMLRELAEEAERKLPEPPPKVQQLHRIQKKRNRKMALILLVFCLALGGILFYGIKYPHTMPLGMGGIFKAYMLGTKVDIPASTPPGEQ